MQFPDGAAPREKEREEPHVKEESLCKVADNKYTMVSDSTSKNSFQPYYSITNNK
jgi:hypothetical protein